MTEAAPKNQPPELIFTSYRSSCRVSVRWAARRDVCDGTNPIALILTHGVRGIKWRNGVIIGIRCWNTCLWRVYEVLGGCVVAVLALL
jgi:hypothetical protein